MCVSHLAPKLPVSHLSTQDSIVSDADVIAQWAEDNLRVPTGLLQSQPYRIEEWQHEWLCGALAPDIYEAGLSVARKNGKTGLIAAVCLAYLIGPLNRNEWRAAVCSLTGPLAKELKSQMEGICIASDIDMEKDIDFRASPVPGVVYGHRGSRIDFLAADKATGHAIGADIAIIDEAGLLEERRRPLWNAIMSCISGRDGKLLCISIRGDGPMFNELAARADEPGVYWREWAADPKMALDDERAWHAANPGLGTIKSLNYMRHQSARALSAPANQSHFMAYDLNLPQEPSREPILTIAQWLECVTDELPPRDGPCFLGVDLGGSASMTARVAYWPDTYRLEAMGAFPAVPDLRDRGEADGVGGRYTAMRDRGQLLLYPGRVADVVQFLKDTAEDLAGVERVIMAADKYRQQECVEAMAKAGLTWPTIWRGQGIGHSAEGATDVRSFQNAALSGRIRSKPSLLMESAIACSAVVRDGDDNPKLEKGTSRGRIDALQAGVLAVGMGERHRARPIKKLYHGSV